MAVGETPGQGCWNTPRIVEYFVTWHMWNGFFGGCFQRLAALFVFCNRKPLFKQNEDISSCLRGEILTNFWSHFGSLGQGFLRPPFWSRRRPWGRGRWIASVAVTYGIQTVSGANRSSGVNRSRYACIIFAFSVVWHFMAVIIVYIQSAVSGLP